ncbi:MAG: chromosomal replication initiator protein DnaA, partial [Acidimicrobiia bacterium]|nr:chromosomal replication initiator protein DnaA [Acidimicrobiia bacterium]
MNDTEELWKSCSQLLRKQVPDAGWRSCLSAVTPLAVRDHEVVLGVPDRLVRDRVSERYLGLIQETAATTLGRNVAIQLEITGPSPVLPEEEPAPASGPAEHRSSAAWSEPVMAADPLPRSGPAECALDPRYTFEKFVIASSNRFAHAAAQSVSESPGRSYNPLFIYGETGLGKTHLMHAIGNYVQHNFSRQKIRYVTCETYMNEFVEAIRTNATISFKRRYRGVDVLLIDDVQFMERKEGLQEEFFHTFNTLHGASKQIVLTSDRPPKSIATLEDRLRSRFMSGLITEIQPPDLETRLAILQTKALL